MSKNLTWTLSKPPAEFHWNIEIPKCPIQKHDTRVSLQMVLVTPPPLLPCHRHNKDGNKNWFKPRVRAWALLIWPDFHHQLSEEETLAALATWSSVSYTLRLTPSCFHLNPHHCHLHHLYQGHWLVEPVHMKQKNVLKGWRWRWLWTKTLIESGGGGLGQKVLKQKWIFGQKSLLGIFLCDRFWKVNKPTFRWRQSLPVIPRRPE